VSAGGGIIVVSDTHISVRSDPAHVARFCEFLNYVDGQGNRICRTVIIAGDLFNFDLLHPSEENVGESDTPGRLAAILAKFPEIEETFAGLLVAGINLTVLPGNHDVELLNPGIADMFRQAICRRADEMRQSDPGSLELSSRTFLRLAGIHIEHGNRFDCDNLFDETSLDHAWAQGGGGWDRIGSFPRCGRHCPACSALKFILYGPL